MLSFTIAFDPRLFTNHPPTDLAKISPHILSPTRFALHLATHLVSKYPHIHKSFVTVDQLRWTRIVTSSKEGVADLEGGHTHAFWRDGDEKKFAKVEVAEKEGKAKLSAKVEGGLRDLLGASVPCPPDSWRMSH